MPKILIVDDDQDTRECLSEILECAGYKVADTENGHQALGWLAAGDFQLVVTDMEMPIMAGADFIREVHRQNKGLPVIAISGREVHRENLRSSNMTIKASLGFGKPIDYPAFLASVAQLARG